MGRQNVRVTSFITEVRDIDRIAEFEMVLTSWLDLDGVLGLIGCLPGGHVMYQTLQPIERYAAERDWTRTPRRS